MGFQPRLLRANTPECATPWTSISALPTQLTGVQTAPTNVTVGRLPRGNHYITGSLNLCSVLKFLNV